MLLAVVDVETTGLHADQDLLLEVAVILYDTEARSERGRWESLVPWDSESLQGLMNECDPFVRDMHTKNGLWDALLNTGILAETHHDIDRLLHAWLVEQARGEQIIWVGNSLRLDLNFIEEFLPHTYEFGGYHSIDLTGVQAFLKARDSIQPFAKPDVTPHRAMADAEICLQQWLYLQAPAVQS